MFLTVTLRQALILLGESMIFGMADALYKGAAGGGLCSMVFANLPLQDELAPHMTPWF
ncbi:MAG TPA: hypothetical protein VG759_05630 [Candidatus Angelobacter sp.]|jgi:hypothetical protein|nr:hypothetical protein [Candidatus Angelobacter sp.]